MRRLRNRETSKIVWECGKESRGTESEFMSNVEGRKGAHVR